MTRAIEVIAEIGICHNGSIMRAREMIKTAKQCGADVAKFQVYDPEKVLDPEHPDIKPWWDLILQTQFDRLQWYGLAQYCKDVGIEFFCSVFDPADVEWLNPLVKRWKIASRSMYDVGLAAAIAETGKPVIVSYGYFDGREAAIYDEGRSIYDESRRDIVIWSLYCISKYPAPVEDHCFVRDYESMFGYHHGFSDHANGIIMAIAAMGQGATIIEKHFTLDHEMDGPDHKCSADPRELAALCTARDQMEILLHG